MNVIPIIAEYPTMRVLMQNVIVTQINVRSVLKTLHEEIRIFQNDLAKFRQKLTERRSKLGYELDVRGDHSSVVDEGGGSDYDMDSRYISSTKDAKATNAKKVDKKKGSKPSGKMHSPRPSVVTRNNSTGSSKRTHSTSQGTGSRAHHHRTSSLSASMPHRPLKGIAGVKKDVWGVGKTGSTLGYILRAGSFALSLLPSESQPLLVLITDGVVRSNLQDESVIRQLSSDDISCSIIQIGSNGGFTPGCNFGFVPDNEILRFVANATNGQFMYAENCPPCVQDHTANDEDRIASPPNIYHYRLLMREVFLDKSRSENRILAATSCANDPPIDLPRERLSHNIADFMRDGRTIMFDDPITRKLPSAIAFPWDPRSEPAFVETRLLRYQEYYLPAEFWHIINARVRQGFSLFSIMFDDNRNRRAANGIEDTTLKKERILITLVMQWQPNVTIEYRVRANWSSTWSKFLKSFPSIHERTISTTVFEDNFVSTDDGMLSSIRTPKAEILIRANSTFSHMLQNWDAFQRRSQMMGIVTGTAGVGDFSGSPGFQKVGKLKKLLVRISETDELLKSLVTFNARYLNDPALQVQQQDYIQKFSTLWEKLNNSEFRPQSRCWFDEQCFDVIIAPSPSIVVHTETNGKDTQNDIQHTIEQVHHVFAAWSTFVGKDQVYVKIQDIDIILQSSKSTGIKAPEVQHRRDSKPRSKLGSVEKCIQFCEIRICQDKERIVSVRTLFFNIELAKRQHIMNELKQLLTTTRQQTENDLKDLEVRHPSTTTHNGALKNIIIAKRPLSSLLMRDPEHYMATDVQIEKQQNYMSKMWYISPTFWLTGEFIVRNYLHRHAWHWEVQDMETDQYARKHLISLPNLAFEYLCHARLEQGYTLIASQRSGSHFYKEVDCFHSNFAVQYYVWKDAAKKKIITELWLEPVAYEPVHKHYESVIADIFNKDKGILTQLVTFDYMYAIGKHYEVEDDDDRKVYDVVNDSLLNTRRIHQASLFNVSSVLRLGTFLLASYPCPKYSNQYLVPESVDLFSSFVDTHAPLKLGELGYESGFSRSTERFGVRSRTNSRYSPASSPLGDAQAIWHSDRNLTCTCPLPDGFFCKHKDAISKLPAIHRDIALLHYYLEQSLAAIAGNDVSLQGVPVDDFWYRLLNAFVEQKLTTAASSTLPIAKNLRDLRCFVKVFDPNVFVVMLIPCLDCVVDGLNKLDGDSISSAYCKLLESDTVQFEHMSLFMFECHRQALECDSDNASHTLLKVGNDSILVKPVDPTSSKEWLDSLGATLRPELSQGYFSDMFSHDTLSDRTLRLMQDVTRVYSRSFVKSVFTCLLHGRAVEPDDFDKVLEICDESIVDIDLTGYLNVQTLLRRRNRTSFEELEMAHQRFSAVLGHYFEPVILTSGRQKNIYSYRPPFAKVGQKLGFSLSGEKPSNLTDVVVCAQNPLFVRLECTFRKPKKPSGYSEVTFPVERLLSSYEGYHDDGAPYDYEPDAIGSLYSPVDSADGITSATLHLVCMALPQTDSDPINVSFTHAKGCPGDGALNPELDKQDALIETEARLNWMFTEEIMHGLLRAGPITQSVVSYIETQLMKKNPFVDFPATMFMPLVFVKNQMLSRQVFFEELQKNRSTPYRLVRVGDSFYASDSSALGFRDHFTETNDNDVFDLQSRINELNMSQQKKHSNSEQESGDEFCQGLGISIFEPEIPDEVETAYADDVGDPMQQQLYWLLLIPQMQSVQIYFYSKLQQHVNRSEIIRVTKAMVNEVMERTNKLVLLQHMHDTRICSKYLLAPNEDDERQLYSSDDFSDEDNDQGRTQGTGDNLVEILSTSEEEAAFTPPKKFQSGQFGCDIVFTKRFPLHWRLQPNAALSILFSDVLRPFAVKNRPNMFVCMRDNLVAYCFLSETTVTHYAVESESQADHDSGFLRPTSPFGTSLTHVASDNTLSSSHSRAQHVNFGHGKSSPHGSGTSGGASPKTSPGRQDSNLSPSGSKKAGRAYETRELVLEIHGVELPSWISEELVDLLENRLTSQITLKEVQQFLMRNPNSKLSRADIEFILPVEKTPAFHQIVRLPALVANPAQFLYLLRQNILVGPLRALCGTDLPLIVKRQRALRYGIYSGANVWQANNSRRDPGPLDPSASDLCFYYSCSNRAPGVCTPFEMNVGQGVAGVCLSWLESSSDITPQTAFRHESIKDFNQHGLESYLDDNFTENTLDECFKLGVDIWTVGQIETGHLFDHVYNCFKQTVCDYIIERTVTLASIGPAIMDNATSSSSRTEEDDCRLQSIIRPFLGVLSKAVEWKSPTVKELSRSVNLPPWCMEDILLQLNEELTEYHTALKPIIARSILSSDLDDTQMTADGYEIYEPSTNPLASAGAQPFQNTRFLLVSGLPELYHKFTSSESIRRQSEDVESLQKAYARSPLGKEEESQRKESTSLRRDDLSIHSRHDSLASGLTKSGPTFFAKYKNNFKDASHRHSFLLFTMDTAQITAYAYNCADAFSEKIFHSILRAVIQQEARHLALKNIVHQKMGLFHHTESMSEIINATELSIAHPNLVNVQQQANRASLSPSIASIVRLTQTDSQSRASTMNSISSVHSEAGISYKTDVNFGSLRHMVTGTFSARKRLATDKHTQILDADGEAIVSIFDVQDGAKLCKSPRTDMMDVVYTAVRIADANTVLRDAFAESTAEYDHAHHRDYLLRHGEPFLNMYLRRAQLQAAHEKAFTAYTKWANRYTVPESSTENIEMMTAAELKLILKASRLLHFCRTPLFFSEAISADTAAFGSASAKLFGDQALIKSDCTTAWYDRLTRTFMREYASYLEAIGMHLIVHGPSNTQNEEEMEAYLSKFKITEDYSISSPVIYLLQVYKGGTIMCEARLTGVFIFVTLYTLHRRYGRLTYSPYTHEKRETRRAGFKDFTEECDKFKQRIHVNSFVFDFHLRHIQRSLDDIEHLPKNLNLLNVIKNMVSVYNRPTSYSRNRIIQGVYEMVMEEKVEYLLPSILRDASKFGLKTLVFSQKPVACFVSSNDLSFENDNATMDTAAPFRHTLIISAADNTDTRWTNSQSVHSRANSMGSSRPMSTGGNGEGMPDKVVLHYFVIVTYRGMDRQTDVKVPWSKTLKQKPERFFNSLNEVMTPATYSLGDVVQEAKKRIDRMISKAIFSCHRDADWSRLYQAISTSRTKESQEQLVALARRFNTMNLGDIDSSFGRFLKLNLRWGDVLDTLKVFYPLISGEIRIQQTRHLLIFVPNAVMDYFTHFEYQSDTNSIAVYVNSKDKRKEPGALDDVEAAYVNNLATTLAYYIWKST
ncbi:hypothetical protein DFQ30_003243 [Apophysomyces sp. BC1015]|nr:hypothetical protein DFQ30_003243 [Apophysomyces sp. BC1015]